MRSTKYVWITSLILCISILSSVAQECTEPMSKIDYRSEHVNFTAGQAGYILTPNDEGKSFFMTDGDGQNLVQEMGLWIGGIRDGNLFVASSEFDTNSELTDFVPGLLDENGRHIENSCNEWNKHFFVSQESITEIMDIFHDEGFVDPELIPDDIKGWPAQGNPFFEEIHGFDLPDDQNLFFVDFFDYDSDGIYDPRRGDYPQMEQRGCGKNVIGDLIFSTFHDNIEHSSSGGLPLRVQVMVTIKATDGYEDDGISVKTDLYNRSHSGYDSLHVGYWYDYEMGCKENDRFGTEKNVLYYYSNNEEEECSDNAQNYMAYSFISVQPSNVEVPFDTIVSRDFDIEDFPCYENHDCFPLVIDAELLNDSLVRIIGVFSYQYKTGSIYTHKDNTNQLPRPTMHPIINPISSNIVSRFGLLTGIWTDGTPLTVGGNGYNPAHLEDKRRSRIFNDPGSSEWNMCNVDMPDINYMIMQSSHGFAFLSPGSRLNFRSELRIADIGGSLECADFIDLNNKMTEERFEFMEGCFDTTNSEESPIEGELSIEVIPNPALNSIMIKNESDIEYKHYRIYNQNGQLMSTADYYNNQINIDDLHPGLYFILLSSQKYSAITRFVKL